MPDGGWFPLLIGLVVFTLLTTWATGRKILRKQLGEGEIPLELFIKSATKSAIRVPGTAVFMTSQSDGVPHALLHNLKHNKVLHERCIFLTVDIQDVPTVQGERRCSVEELGSGFYRIGRRFGFMEEMNVPSALQGVSQCGFPFKMMETSFFLSRQTLLPSGLRLMATWRERLFAWMMRNAESPMEFFNLPINRVVEVGSQVRV